MTQLASPDEEVFRALEAKERVDRFTQNRQQGEASAAHGQLLMRTSAALRKESWDIRMRSRAVRDWAAALRIERQRPLEVHAAQAHVQWFSLSGQLAGRPVSARWERGHLECDPHLLTQAQLLVDLGTVFRRSEPPASVEATLTGEAAAVMLTIARACDLVMSVDFEGPAHG